MIRKILHVDLDSFFCSVEILRQPELEGKPFVVGGSPDGRGVVASASYPARKYGIRSAMPTAMALRKCPELIIISSRHGEYSKYSKKVMDLLKDSAPVVEPISIDEAFLDVSDAAETGESIARSLQEQIMDQFRLPTSWGVASNKLVAKIACEVGKPNGLVVVPQGDESKFLAPLPVEMLWGVGPKAKESLHEQDVKTIGALAALSEARLLNYFGERGPELAARALGIDERPVAVRHRRRSISSERTFHKDIGEETELRRVMHNMAEQLGRRLREKNLAGSTVRIKIRWPDFETITRQVRLNQPTNQDTEIFNAALDLFHASWKVGRKVRLLGVGVADLGEQVRQLDLFDQTWAHDDRLMEAVDQIRNRYGRHALRRASSLKKKQDKNQDRH